jgi:hypothetical protein
MASVYLYGDHRIALILNWYRLTSLPCKYWYKASITLIHACIHCICTCQRYSYVYIHSWFRILIICEEDVMFNMPYNNTLQCRRKKLVQNSCITIKGICKRTWNEGLLAQVEMGNQTKSDNEKKETQQQKQKKEDWKLLFLT